MTGSKMTIYPSAEATLKAIPNWPWEFFKPSEIACSHCGVVAVVPSFLDRMDNLRRMVGFPVIVNSWYRCPEWNMKVSKTGPDGPHTTGRSVDCQCYGVGAIELIRIGLNIGFTGVGVSQKGLFAQRYIHLDDLDSGMRPNIWSY